MIRPSELLVRATRYLDRHGVESPRETAEVLLMDALGVDRAGLFARHEGVDAATTRRLARALGRRCAGTPVQYLTGRQQFLNLTLGVRPGVFIPRPETEGLVLAGLQAILEVPRPVVVDVGTGTGAIALAVKSARSDSRVLATDASEAAVGLARWNADRLGLDLEVMVGDLLSPLPPALHGQVDLVLSNPPYIKPEEFSALPPEVRAEPAEALIGGTMIHRRLAGSADRWLRPGGWLVMEIGADQGTEARSLLAHAFRDVEVLPDLAGRDRLVRGRLPG
jgi:release factor glutamine methyltransferase